MARFIYLKLGPGNFLAEYWLGEENVKGRPCAAIYFGPITADECVNKYRHYIRTGRYEERDDKQIITFVSAWEEREQRQTYFITFGEGVVYFYEPVGPIEDLNKEELDNYKERFKHVKRMKGYMPPESPPKVMPVKIDRKIPIIDVPHVLATFQGVQKYNRKTCVEIREWEILQAALYCLGRYNEMKRPENPEELLSLLSPYELETLVAHILSEAGCFVPAWRGGTLKGIDIIAYNLKAEPVRLGPVMVPPKEDDKPGARTFQVKKKWSRAAPKNVDYLITVKCEKNSARSEDVLTARWLWDCIKKQPRTREWLKRLLCEVDFRHVKDWMARVLDDLINV